MARPGFTGQCDSRCWAGNAAGCGFAGAWLIGVVLAGTCFSTSRAIAQEIPESTSASADALYLLSPQPHRTTSPLLQKRSRDYRGLSAGEFVFYPSLLAGAVLDDNLAWSRTKTKNAKGIQLTPALVAVRDTGSNKTTLYAVGNFEVFPAFSKGNIIGGRTGFSHDWNASADLTVKVQGRLLRKANYVSGGTLRNPAGIVTTQISPQYSDQASGSVSVVRRFGRVFAGLSGEILQTSYATLQTTAGPVPQSARDNILATLTARGGVWFAPVFYAFAEASANTRQYHNSANNSQGQRLVAGIGSDRISLFRGEVFAGIQHQTYSQGIIPDSVNPVFGGKIYWYPTRAWTLSTSVDQTFSDTSVPTPANPNGFPKRSTAANFNVHYQLAQDWSAAFRARVERSKYLGSVRRDVMWATGGNFKYDIYRNLSLTFDYDHYRMSSNEKTASYSHNIYRLGALYRY